MFSYGYPPPPYYQQPPMYPQAPQGNGDYVKFLKKLLKDAKKATDPNAPQNKKKEEEKKKEVWKRAEVIGFAFLTAPLLGPMYIGILFLSWKLMRVLVNAP